MSEKLSLAQAARRWGWSRHRLYRKAVVERLIPCVQIGRTWFFDRDELDQWWQAQSSAHVASKAPAVDAPVGRDRADERAALGLPKSHLFVS